MRVTNRRRVATRGRVSARIMGQDRPVRSMNGCSSTWARSDTRGRSPLRLGIPATAAPPPRPKDRRRRADPPPGPGDATLLWSTRAQRYRKVPAARRVLGPTVACGPAVSEGALWQHHSARVRSLSRGRGWVRIRGACPRASAAPRSRRTRHRSPAPAPRPRSPGARRRPPCRPPTGPCPSGWR